MNVKNKVAIVTGSSSGIGLATASLLTNYGAKVVLAARSINRLRKISKTLPGSLAISTDMTKHEKIRRMVKKVVNHYGRIDILINNAGRGYDCLIEEIDIDKFRYLLELDVIGPIIAMQLVIPIMMKQGGGMIVNISSGTSHMYLPNMGAYSSVKRALNGLTLTAREELKKDKIIVSVVYPYITLTNFDKNMLKNTKKRKSYINEEDNYNNLPPPDSAEYIAGKILEVIKTEKPAIFAHDWMKE